MERSGRRRLLVVVLGLVALSGRASAHIRYVTEGPGDPVDAVRFAVDTLGVPFNAVLFSTTALLGLAGLATYLWVRPTLPDIRVLREALAGYADLVPWMLRLSLGLPLVGAGFSGYLFSPAVQTQPNPLLLGVGFLLLFGLATRAVALLGLALYLVGLSQHAALLLSLEYVPGLLAIVLIGGGRPSADHLLNAVASADGTVYGRIDPVHRFADRVQDLIEPYARYAPTVVRVGLGVAFVYLGFVEKLLQPGRALLVVEQYNLTAVVPVTPEAWVLGAALAEIALGLLLVLGLLTRAVAAAAFGVFTLTLFGLSNDPVLAHITMFGLASAAFTMGSGPLALDRLLADSPSSGRPVHQDGRAVTED